MWSPDIVLSKSAIRSEKIGAQEVAVKRDEISKARIRELLYVDRTLWL